MIRLTRLTVFLLLLTLLLLPLACRSKPDETLPSEEETITTPAPTATPTPTPVPTPTPTPTPMPTPTPAAPDLSEMNLLTGLNRENPDIEQQRPIAIMINNTRKALPQIGIAAADLIFEMPVEGGVTRLMAVFAEVASIPEIGSIRSARMDYVDLTASMDALLAHVGGSYQARDMIKDLNLGSLDYMRYSSAYWRDPNWQKSRGQEHSVKTTGERLQTLLENRDIRTELNDVRPFIDFQLPGQLIPADGSPALYVRAPYSSAVVAEFFYEEASGLYRKHQFGQPHLDMALDQPIQFSNILLLQTTMPVITKQGHVDADLSSGEGFYVSGGHVQAIKWQKGTTFNPLLFFDQAGQPLKINCGKTYIGIVPLSRTITISDQAADT